MAKNYMNRFDVGDVVDPTPVTPSGSLTLTGAVRVPYEQTIHIDGAVINVAAAQQYASLELCTLPNSNMIIVGSIVDVAIAVGGDADVAQADAVDAAVGTAATASTNFAGAGEAALMAKVDGVGASATGTVKGAVTDAKKNVFVVAGASNKVYLNVSTAVTSGTGTITVTGTVTLLLVEIGKPS